MNIASAINKATNILKKRNIETPLLDSEILMSQVIRKDIKYIVINADKKLSIEDLKLYENLINQRSYKKPLAYLLGTKGFWKHDFIVSKGTLIPRPDTEIIIEQVLEITRNKSKLHILDLGVGSGCILLSILKEKKHFYGTGVDISPICLKISRMNATKLNLNTRSKFFKSDIDNFNFGKYDLIVSNPPYIKKLDLKYLEEDVIGFEPMLALDGGLDGMSEIRKVVNKSSELIKKNGKLILEIAFDQKDEVKKILRCKGFYINKVVKDYGKNDRCVVSTRI